MTLGLGIFRLPGMGEQCGKIFPVLIQGSAKRLRPGLVNFVTAVAYHLCLALPAGFTQPGRSLFADPCTEPKKMIRKT